MDRVGIWRGREMEGEGDRGGGGRWRGREVEGEGGGGRWKGEVDGVEAKEMKGNGDGEGATC